jgi:hypothetical protein
MTLLSGRAHTHRCPYAIRTFTAVEFDVFLEGFHCASLRIAGRATGGALRGVQALYGNDHRSLQLQSLLTGDVWHVWHIPVRGRRATAAPMPIKRRFWKLHRRGPVWRGTYPVAHKRSPSSPEPYEAASKVISLAAGCEYESEDHPGR